MVPEGVTLVAHGGGGAALLANLTGDHLALLIRDILTFALWNVHTELDCLLLLTDNLVEDIISLSWSLGALVVGIGEGVTKLLGHIRHLAFARDE